MPRTAHQPRHVRTVLDPKLATALDYLKADLRMTVGELLVEGVILLARYHGRSDGLPEPTAPIER